MHGTPGSDASNSNILDSDYKYRPAVRLTSNPWKPVLLFHDKVPCGVQKTLPVNTVKVYVMDGGVFCSALGIRNRPRIEICMCHGCFISCKHLGCHFGTSYCSHVEQPISSFIYMEWNGSA